MATRPQPFFIDSGVTVWLPLGVVGVSIACFAYQRGMNDTLPFQRFIVSNLGYITAASLLGSVLAFVPLQITPPPGYGYVVKFLIKDFLLLGVLLYFQAKRQ